MKLFKKLDIIIILAVVILYLSFLLIPTHKSNVAEVYLYNKLIKTYNLNDNTEEELVIGEVVIIKTAQGELFFKSSNCPDQVCVHTGKISHDGQSAACLPNGIIIYMGTNDYDKII